MVGKGCNRVFLACNTFLFVSGNEKNIFVMKDGSTRMNWVKEMQRPKYIYQFNKNHTHMKLNWLCLQLLEKQKHYVITR